MLCRFDYLLTFFFNDAATTEIYPLSPTRRSSDLCSRPSCPGGAPPRAGFPPTGGSPPPTRSEEHTSELQSRPHLVCRLLLEKKKTTIRHSRLAVSIVPTFLLMFPLLHLVTHTAKS